MGEKGWQSGGLQQAARAMPTVASVMRHALLAFLAACVMVPAIVHAEPRRLAVLTPSLPGSPMEAGLLQGLRELGYTQGKDFTMDLRNSARTREDFRAHAVELMRGRPELIVVFSSPAASAMLEVSGSTPVVFYVGDPVALGIVETLAKPGKTATGMSVLSPELTGKRLDLLHQLVPKAKRIVYLVNPTNPLTASLVKEAEATARSLGLQLKTVDASTASKLDAALSAIKRSSVDGVLVTDAVFVPVRPKIAAALNAARVPAMFGWKEDRGDQVLASYGPSYREGARRLAVYVDKVLKGADPGQLPVEQDSKYELIINVRAANALGIEVPSDVLLRADEVIR